jgi:hypothetical protein
MYTLWKVNHALGSWFPMGKNEKIDDLKASATEQIKNMRDFMEFVIIDNNTDKKVFSVKNTH